MEQSQVLLMDQIPPEIIINIMEWLNWRELGIISTVCIFPIILIGRVPFYFLQYSDRKILNHTGTGLTVLFLKRIVMTTD